MNHFVQFCLVHPFSNIAQWLMAPIFLISSTLMDSFWSHSLWRQNPCRAAQFPLWQEEMQQGGGCRSRQSKPSFVLIHRSLHLCYRAAGVAGAGDILTIPLASRCTSLNVKLWHCRILMSLWIPAAGEAPLMLQVSALHKEQRWHTSAVSFWHICHPEQYSLLSAWPEDSFWHIDKQISICQC